jgi:preprotein translocase subunit SecE
MNAKVENAPGEKTISGADYAILFVALAIIGGGIFAFYRFENMWPAWVRVLTFAGTLLGGLGVAILSHPGKSFLGFLNESIIEMRRVVWPTRQETTQTTIIVVIAVLIVGVLLFMLDWVLAEIIQYVMGGPQ